MNKLTQGMIVLPNMYNPLRAWVIRRYDCGHYHVNQLVEGHLCYVQWTRMKVRHLADALGITVHDLESYFRAGTGKSHAVMSKMEWYDIPFYKMLHPTDWEDTLFKVSAWQVMDKHCKLLDVRGQAEQFVVHKYAHSVGI